MSSIWMGRSTRCIRRLPLAGILMTRNSALSLLRWQTRLAGVFYRLRCRPFTAKSYTSRLSTGAAGQQVDIHSFSHQSIAIIVGMDAIARIAGWMEDSFMIGGSQDEFLQRNGEFFCRDAMMKLYDQIR